MRTDIKEFKEWRMLIRIAGNPEIREVILLDVCEDYLKFRDMLGPVFQDYWLSTIDVVFLAPLRDEAGAFEPQPGEDPFSVDFPEDII